MSSEKPNDNSSPSLWAVASISAVIAIACIGVYDWLSRKSEREIVANTTREVAASTSREVAAVMQKDKSQQEALAIAQALRIERLATGIASAAGVRTALAEYIAVNGTLPSKLSDLGLPEVTPSAFIESIELLPGPVIQLNFLPKADLDGSVQLRPDIHLETGMIRQWHCTSADFKIITNIGDCQYTGR